MRVGSMNLGKQGGVTIASKAQSGDQGGTPGTMTKKVVNHSTGQDSRVVPDLATSWAISSLFAQSRRDAKFSRICGRG